MRNALRIAATALAGIVALTALAWLERTGRPLPAIDFYHYWVQAQLTPEQRRDIYSPAAQQRLGEEMYQRAASEGQRRDARLRRTLDNTATPFLYATLLWLDADYERALASFRWLLLIAFCAGVLLLGRHARLPWAVTLLALAALLRFFFPLKADVFVGNVGCLQLLGIAGFVAAGARFPRAAGAILALTIAFKPNLLLAAIALIASRDLRRKLEGAAIGFVAAFALASIVYGSPRVWLDWLGVASEFASRTPPRFRNVAPALELFRAYGVGWSAVVTALLAAAGAVALVWSRKRDELLAVSLGVLIALLAPATVWLQYVVLAIPMLFALLRYRRAVPIAAVAAAMLALEPVELLAGRSLVPQAVLLTAPASLLLFAGGIAALIVSRRRELRALRQAAPTDYVYIELTTRCNLRCVYCAVSQPGYRGMDLTIEDGDAFIAEMKRRGVRVVILNGHGETTFVPAWWQLALRMLNEGFRLHLTTNLARELRDDEIAILARFDRVLVSLDTMDAELLARLRRGARLETILHNLDRLRALHANVAVSVVVSDANVGTLPELADAMLARGVRAFRFGDLVEYPDIPGVEAVRHATTVPHAKAAFRETVARVEAAGAATEIDDPLRTSFLRDEVVETSVRGAAAGEKRTHYAEVRGRKTRDCVDPWNAAFVQSNGGVRPCCFIDSSFGQLSTQSLGAIIDGGPFLRLRDELLTGQLRPSCAACPAREVVDVSVLEERVRTLQRSGEPL
ncbi:MAG TPA: radical SAM protein [Thermoanaerobaculia bacterium]